MNSGQLLLVKIQVRMLQMIRTNPLAALTIGRFHKMQGFRLVAFTKLHPIYADFAFSNQLKGYRYLFFDPSWMGNKWGRKLLGLINILHLDAANVKEDLLGFKGKILVECEGAAQPNWLADARIAHVIFQSRYAASRQGGLTAPNIIYPGIDMQKRLKPLPSNSKCITLLTVGYGCLIKGYDISFAIFQQLKQKGYKVRLIIAGKSEHNFTLYPEATKAAFDAGKYDTIEDYGVLFDDLEIRPFYRAELFNEIYSQTFALLHFARMETFGYTLLEAMSFGVPVISVKFKAIPEMVEHGVNGYLCNPFNWDGVGEIDEFKMNDGAWASQCIREGLSYVELLANNRQVHENMRKAAFEKSKQFSAKRRAEVLSPLLES